MKKKEKEDKLIEDVLKRFSEDRKTPEGEIMNSLLGKLSNILYK